MEAFSQKPWLRHYPAGVPESVPLPEETLVTVLAQSARRFPRRPALDFFGKTMSYQALAEQVERFARGLAALGVSPGDRVAICLPNTPEAVIAYFGILKTGGIVVPCNPTYTEHELSTQLRDAGARAVVTLDMTLQKVQTLEVAPLIVTRVTEYMSPLVNFLYHRRHPGPPIPVPRDHRTHQFHEVLGMASSVTPAHLPVPTPDEAAVLQYTGGTTGDPKGAELSHRNLTANIRQLVSWFGVREGVERFLVALPLFHVFSMTVTQNACLAVGGCMVLVPDARDTKVLLTVLRKKKPTVITLVPALVKRLLESCRAEHFKEARFCVIGGSPLPYRLFKGFKERTGHLLIEGYGLTEASPVTHCNIPGGLSVKRSVGLPIPNTEAKLVDELGREVPIGSVGELWVRGPQIMRGYWNHPEGNAQVFMPDGWLATGDMARMDEDGFFYIVDRKKEMILSASGLNVYPTEVERVLLLHPHVQEAAVIGVPSGEESDMLKAFVVPTGDTVSEDELLTHCRQFLASYKVPKQIAFRAELPRSPHGKILHRILREQEAQHPAETRR